MLNQTYAQQLADHDSAKANKTAEKNIPAADKKVEGVKDDSIARAKKSDQELSGLRDSVASLDKSIIHVKHQMDSITALSATYKKDSVSYWEKNNDTLKTALMHLQEMRRAIAINDSLVKFHTDELNSLRKDSSGALSSSTQNNRKREENSKWLDSLSRALQMEKTALYQMQEKIELDSIIQTLTREIQEMQKTGAAAERIEEKQQVIVTNKTKRDDLLRDQKLVAMIARDAKKSPEAVNAKIGSRLIAIDRTLDSITSVQEKISHDNVFQEKEYREKSREIIKRIDTLNSYITKTAHEGINKKAQLSKAQKDSAEAAVKRNENALEYGKKQPPLVEALKNKTVQYESLKRERDAMEKKYRR